MSKRAIHVGHQILQNSEDSVTGAYVRVDGEQYYCIENFDRMDDFFISLVSDSDHWMFISTLGGLTAGRVNAESALFPYYSDDKIRSNSSHTGSRTLTLVTRGKKTSFWEPFSESYDGIYKVNRKLYKNVLGDKIIFEEKNRDLAVTFRYAWRTSQKFGFVKTSTLINNCHEPVEIDIVDGIENLLPYGVESITQNTLSCLVDAYKKNELDESSKLALYTMSSILVDRAEPSEALSATTVWSSGLPNACILLSSLQLQKFREGKPISKEVDIFGRRGAYFVNDICELSGVEEISWDIVAEVNQGPAKVRNLINYIHKNQYYKKDIESDISLGSMNLCRIVATADGLQVGEDLLSVNHHYSNVLFNVMRGGVFENNYRVLRDDLLDFIKTTSLATFDQNVSFVKSLDEEILHENLIRATKHDGDENLQRICHEYLPLSFSRLFTIMMSMTADICDMDELETGERREGVFGAIYWWMVKFGAALAGGASGLILSVIGFDQSTAVQTEETLILLRLSYICIPIIGTLAAIMIMRNYELDEQKANDIRAQLDLIRQKSTTIKVESVSK